MSISWEQRIKHFDRALKPLARVRFRKRSLQQALRRLRLRPSRVLPAALVFEHLRFARSLGAMPSEDHATQLAKWEFAVIRTRLLERKRDALAKIRARRITKDTTGINLSRRRREWLAEIEAWYGRGDQRDVGADAQ